MGRVKSRDALGNAIYNFEWLILPLDRCKDEKDELTSALDDGCISNFERFNFEKKNDCLKPNAFMT